MTGLFGSTLTPGGSEDQCSAEALRRSEVLAKAFLASPDGLAVCAADGTISEVNESFLRLTGLGRSEVIGQRPPDLDIYEDQADRARILKLLSSPGEAGELEVVVRARTGATRTALVSAERLGRDGETDVLIVVRDATDRRRTERALAESEDRFRALADAAPVLIWMSDDQKRGVYFNQTWLEFTGVGSDEQLGEGWLELVHEGDRQLLAEACQEGFRLRRPFTTEFRLRRADGEYRWMFDTGTPRFDRSGAFLGFVGSCVDITERHEAETALRLSEERYRAVVEGQAEMVCRFRPDGEILFVNGGYARARGTAPERLVGRNFWGFVAGVDRAAVKQAIEALTPDAPELRIENRFETTDGVRWTLWTNRALVFDEHGRPTELQSCGIDITDRKLAEGRLAEREGYLRAMFEQAAVGIAVAGLDGRFQEVNQRFSDIVGYSQADLLRMEPADITHPDDRERTHEAMRRLLAGDSDHFVFDKRYVRSDRAEVWSRTTVTVIRDESGGPQRFFGVVQDITARKRAEEALRRAEAQLQLVADHAPVLIAYCDAERRYKFVNKAYAERFGLQPQDVIGKRIAEVVGERAYAAFERYVERVLAGNAVEFELEVPYSIGGPRFMHCAYAPERDGSGRVVGFIAAFLNISERRRIELSLGRRVRQQAALYRFTDLLHRAGSLQEMDEAALEAILSALQCDRASILRFDDAGVMRFVGQRGLSDAYQRAVSGHSPWGPDDADARPMYISDIERADLTDDLRAVIREEGIRALGFIPLAVGGKLIGKFMVYFNSPHEFSEEENELALALSRQLAFGVERQRAEHAVRRSEGLLRAVVETAVDGIVTFDERGDIRTVNPAAERIFGYKADELVGRSVRVLMPEPHDGEEDSLLQSDPAAARRRIIGRGREVRGRRRDGAVFPLDLAVSETWVDGQRVFTGIIRDITERKRVEEELRQHREQLERLVAARTAELEESHRRLRLSERMASLGTLSAGLGHDMGNILVPMRVWIDLLRRMDLPPAADQHLRSLHQSTEYLKTLACGLRSLALDPEDEGAAPRRTILAEWWHEAQGLYRASLPRGVVLHAPELADVPAVAIPPHALTQVVFNLVQNAGHMMRERATGNIWVRASADAEGVRLSVQDDGPGMADDVRQRCMEPFFTTKARGRGTGLGLSIVHTTMQRYGGSVSIESELGRGAEFILTLPVAAEISSRRAACVTIADPRSRAVVRMLLSGMGLEATAQAGAPGPDVGVWVVDGAVDEQEIREFVESKGPARRVVRLGEPLDLGPGVESVRELRPSGLRAALDRAAGGAR